jgi:type II secretory ATPase GspE/PulE/Tfp pilus assembly ATPase PilB-like protein
MRTFLRQDPDVMLVGEMRDPESLGIGIQAGLTGHLVLTTLHTNNAIESIGRMRDMDAEPYLLAGVMVATLAQRLVRLNCGKCRQRYTPTPDEIEMLKISQQDLATGTFAKGAGCPECRGTGYRGRIGIFELILGTPEFRAAIAKSADYPTLTEIAERQGYRPMIADGMMKAAAGWTTPDEVIKAVYTQTLD